jgi:3-phenylpropionate/trans-cinnamate dioxygenase ferredoxin reductase subunit
MLGQDAVYDRVPYFFSDQYDVGMEYAGRQCAWRHGTFRADPPRASSLPSGCATGRHRGHERQRVGRHRAPSGSGASGARVDPERLRDPDLALDELASS